MSCIPWYTENVCRQTFWALLLTLGFSFLLHIIYTWICWKRLQANGLSSSSYFGAKLCVVYHGLRFRPTKHFGVIGGPVTRRACAAMSACSAQRPTSNTKTCVLSTFSLLAQHLLRLSCVIRYRVWWFISPKSFSRVLEFLFYISGRGVVGFFWGQGV